MTLINWSGGLTKNGDVIQFWEMPTPMLVHVTLLERDSDPMTETEDPG